jgi:hypothetical protein
MKFPVQIGDSTAGLEARRGECPVCHGAQQGEPGEFAFLNGGALKEFPGGGGAGPAPGLLGFLSIGLHGAHSAEVDTPSGNVSVFERAPLGQFEVYFCSTKCLRGFLNAAVDDLEAKVRANAG